LLLVGIILSACNNEEEVNSGLIPSESISMDEFTQYIDDVKENPIATITMEGGEEITIELMPKVAPNTVANFITLANLNFYDGLIFHRVIPSFMIQGGDPNGTGQGGPGYTIDGEFTNNGFNNTLSHERGVISMARSSDPNSAGSQFFIMVDTAAHLDGQYASFGKVLSGLEVVDQIVSSKRNASDKPLEDQVIKTIRIDTKGFEYPSPLVNQ
jgi:peptidyl-prolyl cis-trans isomerase B (cyclophilin B)